MSSARESYRRSFVFSVASFLSMGGISLVSSVLLARIYGVTVIGQYALVLSVVLFTMLLSTLHEQTALVREHALLDRHDPKITGRVYAVLSFSLGLTLLIGGVAFAVSSALFRGALNQPDIVSATGVALLGHLLLEKVAWNLDMVLIAFRRAKELFWVRLLQALSLSAIAIGLGAFGGYHSLMSLVLATVISMALALMVRLVLVRRFMRFFIPIHEVRDGFRQLPGYLRFGLRAIGVTIGSVGRVIPTWVLANLGSIAVVGAYSRAEMITTRVTEGIWRVTEMLLPTLVERRKAGDLESFDRSLLDTMRYMVIALLGLAAAVGGSADGVMQAFGPGFDVATNVLVLLMLLPAANAVSGCQEQALYAVDRPAALSIIVIAVFILTIVLTVVLGITFGPTGVAAAMVLRSAVTAVFIGRVLGPYMQHRFTHYWSFRELAVLGISYVAGISSARAVDFASESHLITLVAIAIAIGGLAYGVVFLVLGGLNARDKDRVRELLGPQLRRLRAVRFGGSS